MIQMNQTRAYLIKSSVHKKIFNMLWLTPGESFLLTTRNIKVWLWGGIFKRKTLKLFWIFIIKHSYCPGGSGISWWIIYRVYIYSWFKPFYLPTPPFLPDFCFHHISFTLLVNRIPTIKFVIVLENPKNSHCCMFYFTLMTQIKHMHNTQKSLGW